MTYKRIYYVVTSKTTELRGCVMTTNKMKSANDVKDMVEKVLFMVAKDVGTSGLPFDPFNARIIVSAQDEPKQYD